MASNLTLRDISLGMKDLILRGRYEQEERVLCRNFLSSSDCILEFGAAIGFLGLFCQLNIGMRDYASVEANPRTFRQLLRNYELNGTTPVGWNYALSDHDGVVDLHFGENFWAASTISVQNRSRKGSTFSVPAATTCQLVAKAAFPVTAMIIDIEGAETFLCVSDFPATVHKVIIELHPEIIGSDRIAALSNEFSRTGFRCVDTLGNVSVFLRSS